MEEAVKCRPFSTLLGFNHRSHKQQLEIPLKLIPGSAMERGREVTGPAVLLTTQKKTTN
jgi:hypothetical protein